MDKNKRNSSNCNLGKVEELLSEGKENAISKEYLMNVFVISERELEKEIALERKNGAVILSAAAGGYFLPKDKEEIAEWIALAEKQAKNRLANLRSAKAMLEKIEGQEIIEEE